MLPALFSASLQRRVLQSVVFHVFQSPFGAYAALEQDNLPVTSQGPPGLDFPRRDPLFTPSVTGYPPALHFARQQLGLRSILTVEAREKVFRLAVGPHFRQEEAAGGLECNGSCNCVPRCLQDEFVANLRIMLVN